MTIAEEQGEYEKTTAEGLIATTQPFTGVESVRVELGVDHTGDPSMWLVFRLRPGLNVDAPWVRAFSEYSTKLSLKLIHSGLTRFPYTRLESAA
jgi:hypothetical protein